MPIADFVNLRAPLLSHLVVRTQTLHMLNIVFNRLYTYAARTQLLQPCAGKTSCKAFQTNKPPPTTCTIIKQCKCKETNSSLIECFTLCNEFPLKVLILQSYEIRQSVIFHKVKKNDCLKLQPREWNESSFLSERVGGRGGDRFTIWYTYKIFCTVYF